MKILFICNEYPPYKHGGIGIFIKNLAEKITELGFECFVIGLYDITKNEIELSGGVKIYRYKLPKKLNLKNKIYSNIVYPMVEKYHLSGKIKSLEKLHSFDLIESYEWAGPLFYKPNTCLLLRLHGSNSAYSFYENKKISRFLYYWEMRNLNMADSVVSVSNHLLEITEKTFGILNKKKTVIYNSINDSLFKPSNEISRDRFKIIFVGKFLERKGVFELFKILNFLLKQNSKYHFQFIGNHNDEQKLELLAMLDSELISRVVFSKNIPQNQLVEIFNEASIMIMPSRAEAFGLTVIEAMACGCLVAMSNIKVGTELINDGVDGILINPFEYEIASRKIDSLLEDKNLSDNMRTNALKKIETVFSNHAIIQKNIENYKKLIEN